ncbi:Coatomer subunit delta [Papilio machaon]|uniref:Coatomer subunit delta n=1 Tax=Papilio machaon TaxID=76193 RepID=A0A194RJA1_PAPMA|nr:Coatomer subunit delta [Papilio machaon]
MHTSELRTVLIAATVCTKAGKALVSRQFVEMTKARIEGLLAAFPKLMTGGRQHTFVETESVRYVYQPLDKLYMLLITTKASNILEDLETLRLFSRVVPEYCTQLTETEVLNQAFNLLFAFDEIVALGYRESVNLAQVRSFVEMDSHEEKIYQAVRQTQEREAANRMRERAKELQRERLEAAKRGQTPRASTAFSGGFGNSSLASVTMSSSSPIAEKLPTTPVRETQAASSAMKLSSRGADVDSFVSRLAKEGDVAALTPQVTTVAKDKAPIPADHKDVHLRFEERLSLTLGRDGDIQNFELSGLLTLRIVNEQYGRIHVHIDNKDTRPLQLQTHPNVDKEAFRSSGVIGLKQVQRPFPMHSDVGVLKWRLTTGNDDKLAPLSVNCWPSEGANGGCDVNIEYELEQDHLVLTDVVINIPLPSGNTSVVVHQWEGSYSQKGRTLLWSIPVVNRQQKTGSLEFTVTPAIPNDFFPITVTWTSETSLAQLTAVKVTQAEDGSPVDFSQDISFRPDKYEVV